ncbi:hypothetical protein FRX31_029165, partial [Thalictrum thalictroides]
MHGETNTTTSLRNTLQVFNSCTGLAVNTDKSQLFFAGVANAIKEDIINVLQNPVGELPI